MSNKNDMADAVDFIIQVCGECYYAQHKDVESKEFCLEELETLKEQGESYRGINIENLQETCRNCDLSQPYVKNALLFS